MISDKDIIDNLRTALDQAHARADQWRGRALRIEGQLNKCQREWRGMRRRLSNSYAAVTRANSLIEELEAEIEHINEVSG